MEITTTKDVKKFALKLKNDGVIFHCDENFLDYINLETNKPTYTTKEANDRNKLMSDCFEVCRK